MRGKMEGWGQELWRGTCLGSRGHRTAGDTEKMDVWSHIGHPLGRLRQEDCLGLSRAMF